MDSSRPSEGPSPIPPKVKGRSTKQPLQSKPKPLDPKPKKKAPHGKEKEGMFISLLCCSVVVLYVFLCLIIFF